MGSIFGLDQATQYLQRPRLLKRLLKRLFGFKSSEIQVTTASLTIGPASRSANNPSVEEPQDATLTARHNDEGNDRPT